MILVSLTLGCRPDHQDECAALAGLSAVQENHHQAGYGYVTWSRAGNTHYQCPAHITLPPTNTSPRAIISVSVSMPCITAMLMDARAFNLTASRNPFDQPSSSPAAKGAATSAAAPPPMLRIQLKTGHAFAQLDLSENHDLHQLRAALAQAYPLKTPSQVFTQEFAWQQSKPNQLIAYQHCSAQDEHLNGLLAGASHLLASGMSELKVRQQCFVLGAAHSFEVQVPSSELASIKVMPHNKVVAGHASHEHESALEQFAASIRATQQNREQTLGGLRQNLASKLALGLGPITAHAITLHQSAAGLLIVQPWLDHTSSSSTLPVQHHNPAVPAATSPLSVDTATLTSDNLSTMFYASHPTISRLTSFHIQTDQPQPYELGDLLIIDNRVYGSLVSQIERSYSLASSVPVLPSQTVGGPPPAGVSHSPSFQPAMLLQEDPSKRDIRHAYQAIPTSLGTPLNSPAFTTWIAPAADTSLEQLSGASPAQEPGQNSVNSPTTTGGGTSEQTTPTRASKATEAGDVNVEATITATTTPGVTPYNSGAGRNSAASSPEDDPEPTATVHCN